MKPLPVLRAVGVCAVLFLAGTPQAYAQTAGDADSAATRSASETYEQALVAYNLGEIRTAYIFLKNALQADPFLLPAHLLLGKIYLQLGHGDRAEKELLIAEGLGTHRSLILIPLARAYLLQDKPGQVIAELFPLGAVASEDAELLALRGEAYLQLQQTYDARRAFTQALERDPRSVPALLGRIRGLLQQGDINEAAHSAKGAVELAPGNGEAWYYKGLIARGQGDVTTALRDFERACDLLPTLLPAQVGRIGVLMDLGRMDEAEEAIAAVRKIYPSDPRTLYLEAVAKSRRGAGAEARAAMQGAARLLAQLPRELIDGHPPTLLLAGIVSFSLKHWEQANDYLAAYIAKFPDAVGPRILLAQVALDRQQNELAIKILEPALAQVPGDQRVLSLLAEGYMREGQHLKASQLIQDAIEAAGDNVVLRTQRAVNQFGLGRQGEAIQELGSVFDLQPELANAGATLVVMLLKHRRYDQAVEKAIRLVAEGGANLTYINLLGVAALAKEDYDLAHWAFELVLAFDAKFLPAQLNLAELALRRGSPIQARERLDDMLAAYPGNVSVMLLLARAYEAQGQIDEARRVAEQAVDADHLAVPAVLYLADLLLKANDAPQALSLVEGLEARMPNLDDVDLMATLSRAYMANGQRASAQVVLQRASSIAGYDAPTLLTVADLQKEAGDLVGAGWSLEKAVDGDPTYLPTRIKLGELQTDLGQMDRAAVVAHGLLEDYPDKPFGYHLLGTIRQKEGDDRAALENYRAALERQDSPVLAVRVYGAERRVNGDAAALAFLGDWVERHPGDLVARTALADGYFSGNQWERARVLYEQALAKTQDNPLLLNNLALIYLSQGDPRALDYSQRAFSAMPGSSAVADTLGWVLVRTGDINEGLKYLRDALSRAGLDPGIRYHVAYALGELGRRDEAIAELEAATGGGRSFAERDDALQLLERLRRQPASSSSL
jgi:putative PEP-CTERM system TPR-repeat lipoprotein